MSDSNAPVDLDPSEVALVLGQDGTKMTVRIHAATEPEEGGEIPEPFHVAVALAMRLLKDPDFHDEMLDWYEDHADDEVEDEDGEDDEDEEDEDGDDEEEADGKDEGDGKGGAERKGG